ncbi:MAG: TRAP transporter large permease [Bacillota bacterium]
MTIWLLLPFVIGLVVGVPISFSLALGVLTFLISSPIVPLDVLTQRMYTAAASFPLMAIPFFVLAGDLMNRTGITLRLISFAKLLIGNIRGGLAQVMVITATIFAGLSGSAVADTAAMVKILAPTMEKEGYDKEFAAALSAASGVIGPVIPPSTMMIVYGAVMNVSIGAMFIGGILPGLVLALGLMITSYIISVKRNYPKGESKLNFKLFIEGTKDASLALIMPIIILIGIRGGVFTPTEGGAVAVLYSLLLGFFVYKSLNLKAISEALLDAGVTSAVIMFIVAASSPFGWILTLQQAPQVFADLILNITTNKYLILLIINLFLLFMGMFMETAAIILLLAPILAPIAVQVGVDPVHFALIMVINLCIGMCTPPLGVNLFVAAPIAGVSMEKISRSIVPFIFAHLVSLLLINLVPPLSLWLPKVISF